MVVGSSPNESRQATPGDRLEACWTSQAGVAALNVKVMSR